ncbi:MAG: hypothetical protein K6A42_10885 [Treponema sp.]|nr:hypothetical protein [Treponema sp.]
MTMKDFLIGAAVGAAVVAVAKTPAFRKGCAKVVAAGLQLKDDATEYFETLKEDAEDAQAEKQANANA